MQRLRTTFTRSRTPTGAEMKTQNSLEVPKQVRSASFDEMQLEAQRTTTSHLLKQQSSSSADERSSDAGFLQVPLPSHQQRSRSFDSTAGSDDSGTFLEVPRHSKTRRTSATKTPPPCIHCHYLEEYERQIRAQERSFLDHRELGSLSYSYSSTDDDDDDDDEDDDEDDDDDDDDDSVTEDDIHDGDGAAVDDYDDAALEVDIHVGGMKMGSSIEDSRARLPSQMRRHTIGSSMTTSTSEDEGLEESEYGSPHYGNTLLPPPLTAPCGITFTLSPTSCDCPPFPAAAATPYGFLLEPGSPPASPASPAFSLSVCGSPVLELPPPPPVSPLELLPQSPSLDVPLPPPPAFSCGAAVAAYATDGASATPAAAPIYPRRRSISRQEAIFVEPTGNSLENVAHEEEPLKSTTADSLDDAASAATKHAFVVRDFYLAVPDLKRDRAASVDSCFSKLSSGGKTHTEELQPSSDGCFLAVPNINATRSRSVDIVLPTDEQARYKALAMTGRCADGYVSTSDEICGANRRCFKIALTLSVDWKLEEPY